MADHDHDCGEGLDGADGRREAPDGSPVAARSVASTPVQHLYAEDVARLLDQLEILTCERPIWVTTDTGEVVQARCRSRRVAQCRSCAALYQGDAAAILRAGALDVEPGSVLVMLTLTAPSFGQVHRVARRAPLRLSESARTTWNRRAQRSRCACGTAHRPGDRLAGTALDIEQYDYARQARWNAAAGRLWNRTATRLTRDVGLDERLPYAAVSEWQARGAIHFHALVRLPVHVMNGVYQDQVGRIRCRTIEASVKASTTVMEGEVIKWGSQVVAEVLAAPGLDAGRLAKRTIGYVRKALGYSIKDVGGGLPSGSAHARRCDRAGRRVRCPHCVGPSSASIVRSAGRLLGSPCHSPRHTNWGYAGHPLKKSRTWSAVTFRMLRMRRTEWKVANTLDTPCDVFYDDYVTQGVWRDGGDLHDGCAGLVARHRSEPGRTAPKPAPTASG